ncbi:UNVERIFIED_CONTAM: hypothetical protein NCL1_42329 [Trichonephila clavipes]
MQLIRPFSSLGIVNLEFELPYDYPEGWWTIKAVALGQTEETRVLLERWFTHRFDFHGTYDFSISLAELRNMAVPVPLENCEIEIQAAVGERFYDFTVFAYGRVRVVNSTISLRFLGVNPQVFKPGMSFKTHIDESTDGKDYTSFTTSLIAVSYSDLVPLSEEKLVRSNVIINPVVYTRSGRRELEQQILPFNSDGVVEVVVETPKNAEKVIIRTIHKVPCEALHIYIDGRMGAGAVSGSGIFIKKGNDFRICKRNSDYCSVFRAEFLAIEETLKFCFTGSVTIDIWIFSDSRSFIQPLSEWWRHGDRTTTSIV